MRKALGTLILLFIVSPVLASPVISEIHARTPEWIEIWNPAVEHLNLSNWLIADSSTNNPDEITCWEKPGCSISTSDEYFIILGRGTNISDITNSTIAHFYTDDQRIGNGLNDAGDTLSFFNSSYYSNHTYPNSTTSRSWALLDTVWIDCMAPTPGKENGCGEANQTENQTSGENPTENNQTDSNQTEQNQTIQDNQTVEENQTEPEIEKPSPVVESDSLEFSLLSAPASVWTGEMFEVSAMIRNLGSEDRIFEAYSYVFTGSTLLSDGLTNNTWKKTWDANRAVINVPSEKAVSFSLRNRIRDGTAPGTYKLRIRIADEDDLDTTIIVKSDPIAGIDCVLRNGTIFAAMSSSESISAILAIEGERYQERNIVVDNNLTMGLKVLPDIMSIVWHNKTLATCDTREAVRFYKKEMMVMLFIDLDPLFSFISSLSRLTLDALSQDKS